ncbi:MAG: deoxyribose-phosphate aldolase [Clostridia bacterium]|nr:deoxyribose-phosphate aldolase [Clostridia bacterium]
MANTNYAPLLDAALLEPETTLAQLRQLCDEAKANGYAAVAVMPSRVRDAAAFLAGSPVKVDAAIGFPFGMTTPAAKAFEAAEAIDNGAAEIDMVINIGKLKDGNDGAVYEDMRAVVTAVKAKGDYIVKAILETGLLTEDEIVRASRLADQAGMDFVKTSTGFRGEGATVPILALMREHTSARVQLKASGQVRTYEKAAAFTHAGCTRLGTSAKSARAIAEAASKKGVE